MLPSPAFPPTAPFSFTFIGSVGDRTQGSHLPRLHVSVGTKQELSSLPNILSKDVCRVCVSMRGRERFAYKTSNGSAFLTNVYSFINLLILKIIYQRSCTRINCIIATE